MSSTQTYKIIIIDAPIRSNPSLFAPVLGILKQNTLIEVISIDGDWAKFKYENKNAYILILFLEKIETITTGSINVKYLNVDTNEEIAQPTTHNFLKLKSYSYIAPNLDNYTIIEPNKITVTLTLSNPNQNIIFYYKEKKVSGSVTIKYIDTDTNLSISEPKVYENLELKTYSYDAIDILGYKVSGESTKYVTLSKDNPKQTLIFEYSQVLGKVTIKYLDLDTKKEIAKSDFYTNLSMGEYTYSAKSIEKYTLVGENTKSVTLTYDKVEQLLSFEYKKDSSEYQIYTVTNNLTNCKTSNNATSINSASAYTTTITANSGYTISSITVIMSGTNITSTAISGNVINISKITGNVIVTAVAILSSNENINNDITILGSNISIPNGRGTINSYENEILKINTTNGDRIAFTINNLNLKDNTDYKFSCSFDHKNSTCFESLNSTEVYTGGIKFQKSDVRNYNDISFTFNSYNWSNVSNPAIACAIHGTSVVGIGIFNNIKITKISKMKKYVITNELTNVTNNNNLTEIEENQYYTATIVANSGYTVNTITVTMGGLDITKTVVSENLINIPKVTGNIIITANAITASTDSDIGDVSKLSYDVTTVPQITHYYYPGKQKISSNETIIPIYFADYYQREYYYEDTSLRFNLRIDVDGNVRWINNLPAGDHDISLGVLPVGEHIFSFEVTQVGTNLKSQRLFNKVWIVDNTDDITAAQTYNVTSNDLSKHNITLGLTSSATKEQMSNNRNGMREMLAEIHDKGYRKIILPANSIIRINATENDTRNPQKIGSDRWAFQRSIVIPTNTTVDLNGSTIKLHPYDDREFGDVGRIYNYMVTFTDCVDSHLINGTLEGDYLERQSNTFYNNSNGLDHGNGEHCSCITINGGRYNSIDNLTIKQITGYNCQCEKTMTDMPTVNMCYHWGENLGCWLNGNNKDIINGVETTVAEERCTSDFVDISKLLPYKAFSSGKMLSDYPSGGYYEVLLSFYDENKNFIESFVGYQAREADIPANSKYLRITINGKHTDLSAEPDFFLMSPFYAEYTEWNNIEFVDNRTCCNPNRFKHLRIYNCNFTRSGQSITPLALDAEDGGANMQDIFIENCSIKEYASTQTGDAICVGGLNVVMQNNNNLSWGIRTEVIGATIRNNVGGLRNCGINKGWRGRNTIRCYNNEFKGFDTRGVPTHLSMGFTGEFDKKDALLMIKGCKVVNHDNSGWVTNDLLRQNLIFKDCDDIQMGAFTRHINNTIYINSTNSDAAWRTGRSKFYKCTFTRKTTGGSDRHEILSYNYGNNVDDIGTYDDCVFNFPGTTVTVFGDLENAFIKGEFNNCTFKTPMIFKLLYANNMGDIKFNNCKFEAELTLNLRDTKIQFNGCTFNGITYLNNGQANSQFN